ncbi:MAG: hypothetical protein HY666_00310 [Chloroflexi bacterium]|nr:hypothetical protein [Chloroflexota bacterium]
MFEPGVVKRHRWSALLNGIVIGFGLMSIMSGVIFGALPMVVGIAIEVWQRKRLSAQGG